MGSFVLSRPGGYQNKRTAIVLGDSITAGSSALANGAWQFGKTIPEMLVFKSGIALIKNSGISRGRSNN